MTYHLWDIFMYSWKIHLVGYNYVTDSMGLFSLCSHRCFPNVWNRVTFPQNSNFKAMWGYPRSFVFIAFTHGILYSCDYFTVHCSFAFCREWRTLLLRLHECTCSHALSLWKWVKCCLVFIAEPFPCEEGPPCGPRKTVLCQRHWWKWM